MMTVSSHSTSLIRPESGADRDSSSPPGPPPPPSSLDNVSNNEKSLLDSYPIDKLMKLEDLISNPRWVIPVLPKGELEVLLESSIELCRVGLDTQSDHCQRFYREGLTTSFTKIMTDEAVSSWRLDIHRFIFKNCERLVELSVLKLGQKDADESDWVPLLELLALVLDPCNKFHIFNSSRLVETENEGIFACSSDVRPPKGWLVQLINLFGRLGGFDRILEMIKLPSKPLTVGLIQALLRPFGQCHQFLTHQTIVTYLLPIVDIVPKFLESLSDDELKKESSKGLTLDVSAVSSSSASSNIRNNNDALSSIIKSLKAIVSAATAHSQKKPDGIDSNGCIGYDETTMQLEMFRLKMILRQLKMSSFSGKMNALNEIIRVISVGSFFNQGGGGSHLIYGGGANESDDDILTSKLMAVWLKEKKVLQLILQDSLHQPQYVEKLERIIRFAIKESTLTMEDLDDIWSAQIGQHDAIVKNVRDLLSKLAWDFTPEQLDHLFECFQNSLRTSTDAKQHEKILELIRRLAEDDKDGVMADKVLGLFWNLAHSEDSTNDIMDQSLAAHIKILDYSSSQYKEVKKLRWLERCIEELKTAKWVLPALKQIQEILCLYPDQPQNVPSHPVTSMGSSTSDIKYKHEVITKLQSSHSLVILVADNLVKYMENIRSTIPKKILDEDDPTIVIPDGRYNHKIQVQERLNFLRFLLREGQLWLCALQAKQIWNCLAENSVFTLDREACFRWFFRLMGEEPDLDPEINKDFFENNILQLDPNLLTENGIKCFERFFKAVNCKEKKLIYKKKSYLMDDIELVGLDYLWRLVLCNNETVAAKAIELIREVFTNLGPRLQTNHVDIHDDFISSCMDRLKASYDTISILQKDSNDASKFHQETTRLCRVIRVLQEYVCECDNDFRRERFLVPLFRASRGCQLMLIIRFNNQNRQTEEVEIWTHSNETLGSVRLQILQGLKGGGGGNTSAYRLELYLNGELLDSNKDDYKILLQLPSLHDKSILTGKLVAASSAHDKSLFDSDATVTVHGFSSPDTSSGSSASSPQHNSAAMPVPSAVAAEQCLPGVILSARSCHTEFLLKLADLGCSNCLPTLRDGARDMLGLMPADASVVQELHMLASSVDQPASFDNLFLSDTPSRILYHLEVLYSLLLPSTGVLSDKCFQFQLGFVLAGSLPCLMSALTNPNFLVDVDVETKRSVYLVLIRILKFLFVVAGHSLVHKVAEAFQSPSENPNVAISAAMHSQAVILQQALHHIPESPNQETILRTIGQRLAARLLAKGATCMPQYDVILALMQLAWSSAAGDLRLFQPVQTADRLHQACLERSQTDEISGEISGRFEDVDGNGMLCCETIQVLTLAIALNSKCFVSHAQDKSWKLFILDLVILSKNYSIREMASDQFLLISTRCLGDTQPLNFMISLLFDVLPSAPSERPAQSGEYFSLLSRLLAFASSSSVPLPNAESLLASEISWLATARQSALADRPIDIHLLEGHLCLCRELLAFISSEKRNSIGQSQNEKEIGLVCDLVENFIFPASKMLAGYNRNGHIPVGQNIMAVCRSGAGLGAAFDLLVGLCTGCLGNLGVLSSMLTEMFYTDKEDILLEWEYLPPMDPRPESGFVGLRNAGATCYMNSVLQQLFMIDDIRNCVLSVEGACNDIDEDFSGEEAREIDISDLSDHGLGNGDSESSRNREYNITILKQIQAIFGHLALTKLQFYLPRGLWKHFRMQGEPVNLREQQDAVEFFMSVVEFIDEAMKSLGYEQRITKILGGIFSDQKICKTCPHRYSREEPFSVISLDVKNHSTLVDSLYEYVKGELLDGSNAYFCERCNKKVDTVKRMCVKKLPPILVIQLKRFDYDYERECATKFNDYFEFPRNLDMLPYTEAYLERLENEQMSFLAVDASVETSYRLRGMVVHSGQASGGHYYSYIQHRQRWYRFDDAEISEIKMEDDEELKVQCFGGEYMSEVYDHITKRTTYRKTKRWWNAYMLFYARIDMDMNNLSNELGQLSTSATSRFVLPAPIERSIQRQNIRFLHHRNQYTPEYFSFMRKLVACNVTFVSCDDNRDVTISPEDAEGIAMVTIHLASKFLFSSGLRAKKTLRGPVNEWYDILTPYLRYSRLVRLWFCQKMLFAHPSRFCDYIMESPSVEVRTLFVRLIVFISHFSLNDPIPVPVPSILQSDTLRRQLGGCNGTTLADHLLQTVLALLWHEVSEHGRHLSQYFTLFLMYASLGTAEKLHLLKLNVPATFIQVAIDEGPGPCIKYQYAEFAKLYHVVSQLVRCCDVSSRCQASGKAGKAIKTPNPYLESSCNGKPLMVLQPQVGDLLFQRYTYMKKLMDDAQGPEETKKLLQYCCWENPAFSHSVLYELLWFISSIYTYELRGYFDLLTSILLIADSWQNMRIVKALMGIFDELNTFREGLLDIINRSKMHSQKRAYQCIKMIVALFSQCETARLILDSNDEIKRRISWAIEWLNDELEREPGGMVSGDSNAFFHGSYSNVVGTGGQYFGCPPVQSNETANGYYLERTHSARLTLEKACQLLPEMTVDDRYSDNGVDTTPVITGESSTMNVAENSSNESTSSLFSKCQNAANCDASFECSNTLISNSDSVPSSSCSPPSSVSTVISNLDQPTRDTT